MTSALARLSLVTSDERSGADEHYSKEAGLQIVLREGYSASAAATPTP